MVRLRTKRLNWKKGAIAGAIGGVAGALAMSGFAALRSRVAGKRGLSRPELENLEARRYVAGSKLELDSIELAADQFDRLLRRRLSPGQKSAVAAGVHFKIAVLLGAAYGVAAEAAEFVTRGHGTGFALAEATTGNLIWTVATRGYKRYSITDQVESLADHAVYGAVLETVRGLVRRRLDGR